jgi:hypothetical protein
MLFIPQGSPFDRQTDVDRSSSIEICNCHLYLLAIACEESQSVTFTYYGAVDPISYCPFKTDGFGNTKNGILAVESQWFCDSLIHLHTYLVLFCACLLT